MAKVSLSSHSGWEAAALATIDLGLILLNPIDPGPHIASPHDEMAGGALVFLGATGYAMINLFGSEGVRPVGKWKPGDSPGVADAALVFSGAETSVGYGFGYLLEELVEDAVPYLR